jgi:peptide/nickel transport system ATP-binding protein
MEPEILLSVQKVTKTYGGRAPDTRAVDDVSLSIYRGEVLGLIGESGCGKTTLAKMVLGLMKTTSGKIVYLPGTQVKTRSKKRPIQVVFQDPYDSLSLRLTVRDIVAEPLVILRKQDDEKVKWALEAVGLAPAEEYYGKYANVLSGGQRQRVAIARAIVSSPVLIVADEPISMLDVSVGVDILNLLRDLNQKLGVAVLFITHDISAASYVCGRIAVMNTGRIVECGSKDVIISSPVHPYTKLLVESSKDKDPEPRVAKASERGECCSIVYCKSARNECRSPQKLVKVEEGHYVACPYNRIGTKPSPQT